MGIAKREIASILRCDLTLIISSAEIELLQDVYGIDNTLLHYVPFLLDPVDVDHAVEALPAFEQRRDFMFIGNFQHAPNWDAVQYLKQTIWPLIRRQLPKAQLHI